MDRLSGFLERRRYVVLGVWVGLLLASIPFAMRQTDHLTAGGFGAPGSGSEAVDRALADFEHAQDSELAVVLAQRPDTRPPSAEGTGGDVAAVRREVDRVDEVAADLSHVELTDRAEAAAKREAGQSPITIVSLEVRGSQDEVSDLAVDLREDLGVADGARDGVEPHLVGQTALWAGMQDLSKEDLAAAETTGFPIVLLILLAVFGSLAAAALPLALGFVSVMVTGAAVYFLSQATDMSVFVTNVASMIGIGVAVDYSLFVLARYREEIRAGVEPDEARRVALRTSGLAVVFSGLTVMVSLAGLFLVNSTTIRSMAMGAIIVVAVSILAAVTFLPVLMRLFGKRAYARGRVALTLGLAVRAVRWRPRRRGSSHPDNRRGDFWERWTARVTRRPLLAATASAAFLLVLAIPALSLEFGDGALRQFPEGNETRVGAELAAKELGPGAAGPTQVVAKFTDGGFSTPDNQDAMARYMAGVKRDPEVASVGRPQPARGGGAALIGVVPRHDPESSAARAMVDRLRYDPGPLGQRAEVEVGGATASVEDFKDLVAGSMWKILVFVLAFSYLVLFVLLRSVFLPLKAVIVNLLSVFAAYGVLVAVFQYGWLDGLLGFDSLGYINTITPPFLLAIVFGLSMDYEVFLLSRMREEYDRKGDNAVAVADGLAATARVITAAALIMILVFSAFVLGDDRAIKLFGFGLAIAVFLDATIVRLILVPATMELLGDWNWWIPKWLDRILPVIHVEPAEDLDSELRELREEESTGAGTR